MFVFGLAMEHQFGPAVYFGLLEAEEPNQTFVFAETARLAAARAMAGRGLQ
jgi:hypothetical protein